MGWNQQPSARNVTTQTIAYDATVAITNAFGPQIKQIRLAANSACHYRVYAAARLREHRELQDALTESNVIPFRRKH